MEEITTETKQLSEKERPGKGKYILAWIVWAILNTVIGSVIGMTLITMAGSSAYSWSFWVIIMPVVSVLIAVGVFYLNYRVIFKTLNPWRVLPYVYTLGTIGYISGAGRELETLRDILPPDTTGAYATAMIGSWILILYIIRNQIVAKTNYSK